MRMSLIVGVFLAATALAAAPARAQRVPFERSVDAGGASHLDVSTVRGSIHVTAGPPGRIVVAGTVTARIGLSVPANALQIARSVAADPPIEQSGDTIRLRPPADEAARRAVTISYRVQIPPGMTVETASDSGATTVRGVAGYVTVQTQSGAIELASLDGPAAVTTGSGSVKVNGVGGALTVTTASSAFTARDLGSSLHVRTGSGSVEAAIAGDGDVDVETGSSAIRLTGLRGGLRAATQSGSVTVRGVPGRPWVASTGSSGVDMTIASASGFSVDIATRSGSIQVARPVDGSVAQRRVTGTIGGGGPLVQITSGSGSIRVGSAAH